MPFRKHSTPSHETHRHLPWRKRLAFTAIIAGGIFLITEGFAWAALGIVTGKSVSYASLAEERAQVASSYGKVVIERIQGERDYLENRVIHPYMGYADGPSGRQRVHADNEQMDQYGFSPGAGPFIREPADDEFVIAIFGGSVARLFLDTGGTDVLRERLEASPEFAGKRIVIDDLGVFGFKQPQQLMAFNYLLSLGAHFDAVINLDGFNEVALPGPELLSQNTFPFYPPRWRSRASAIDADPAVRLLVGEIAVRRDARMRSARMFDRLGWSMTAQLLWKTQDRRSAAAIDAKEAKLHQRQSANAGNFATQGPLIRYDSEQDQYADLVQMWHNGALQMHLLATANGALFIEALQPNQYAPNGKIMGDEERAVAWSDDEPYKIGAEKGYPLLIEKGKELAEKGVRFHDLSQLFGKIEEPIFTDACCHFNDKGNAILAEKLADILIAEVAE